MKFFIPLLLFMFMFNSCEQSKEFIIKLDLRAATSNVYWQKCGTKMVFNGNVVGTYCNDDVDGSIFKFTDSTFNRKAYGFSLVTGQTDLVKKHIILIPIAISKWKELNPIIVGTTYRITEDGLGIYYPEMKNTMLTNERLNNGQQKISNQDLDKKILDYRIPYDSTNFKNLMIVVE